jgi:Putative peptidoglycan binding domain
MANQIILLLLGFLLTSVVGGVLGSFFQQRTWQHQHDVQQREQERQQAIKVFEEISSLLDKRLYRMELMYWATRYHVRGDGTQQMNDALVAYRKVLQLWNDNLNRHLALIMTFFGKNTHEQLEEIYERYTSIGRALDQFMRDASQGPSIEIPPIGRRLTVLSKQVYNFNLGMLNILLDKSTPGDWISPATSHHVIEFGDRGPEVFRLQEMLRITGHLHGPADGIFGTDTTLALRQFQKSSNISVDAIAGPSTWAVLSKSTGQLSTDKSPD